MTTVAAAPVRVALLDDHPAVRTGLTAILEQQTDVVMIGTAASEHELWPVLRRERPDVVVLDLHHPGRDGLALCLRIKRAPDAPRVVLYSASAVAELLVPATLAGADAIVDKSSPADDLVSAIRSVASGERTLAPIPPWTQARAAAELDPAQRPLFAMRLAGTSTRDIGATLNLTPGELARRTAAMVSRLARIRARPV
jgi:DNA-binding NarL/FixJ family response regulator